MIPVNCVWTLSVVKGMKSKCDIRLYHTESLYKTENEQFSTFRIQGFKTLLSNFFTFSSTEQIIQHSNEGMDSYHTISGHSIFVYTISCIL